MVPMPITTPDSSALIQAKQKVLSFAEALFLAGNEHKFQKKLVFLLSLQRISIGFLFTAFPFLFKQPKFQCRDLDDTFYLCDPTPENCKFDIMPVPGSDNSLITYFGLYCDNAEYANLAKNLFTAACSIGVLIIFPLADRMGRRPGLIASYVLGALSLLLLAFIKSWWIFAVLLTLAGLGLSPYLTNSFLLLNENSGAKMRANASVIINSFWTIGQIVVGVLAYLLNNDWRYLVLFGVGLPLVLLLPPVIIWTRESPMFLASRKRFQEAKDILKTIAYVNGKELPEFDFTEERNERRRKSDTQHQTYGFMDLFKFRSLKMTTLLGSFLCFTIYFNYYGTIFALASVQVNAYVLTIVLAVAELIAYYTSGLMAQKLSRRISFAICSIVCCVANLLFMAFELPSHCVDTNETCYQVYIQLILSTINRFTVSIAMALSGIYVSEIFPTSVRAIGSGLIVFVARLGSFIATLVIAVCLKYDINPIIIFGAICLPATLVSFVIKETQGLPLPESIEEEKGDCIDLLGDFSQRFQVKNLYQALQRKFSVIKNKESIVKLKEDFNSETTASSVRSRTSSSVEPEFDI